MKPSSLLPWVIVIFCLVIIYNLWKSNDVEILKTQDKKEVLEKSIDSVSVKQQDLAAKAKDSAKAFSDKGNQIIKVIYYEKKPIVVPAADSVNRFIAAYTFTQR